MFKYKKKKLMHLKLTQKNSNATKVNDDFTGN